MTRYEQIARDLERLIASGSLRAGDKAPSVRKLHRTTGASVSTILHAYALLERAELIEARERSGFVIKARLQRQELPTCPRVPLRVRSVEVPALVSALVEAGREPSLAPFGTAVQSPELLPGEQLARIVRALSRDNVAAALAYEFPPGSIKLRRQIARRSIDWGCALSADDLVITSGCVEALQLCLRAIVKAGDVVAVESPTCYGVLYGIFHSLKLRVLELPTDPQEGLVLSALHAALGKMKIAACLLVPNFNNPLGSVMPDAKKQEIVELLARRNVPLIEDDIYADLHFGASRPKPAKAFDRKGLVLLCSSFSKTIAPGYRIGWSAPGRFAEAVRRLKFTSSVAAPTLPQMALAEFLGTSGYDRHLRLTRARLFAQMSDLSEAVARNFPSGTRMTHPQGGLVLWVELPGRADATDLYRRALEEGIGIAPGPIFSSQPRYQKFIRLNFGYPLTPQLERAIVRLGSLAHELA